MTTTEAKKVVEAISAKAEKAFCEEYGVQPGEYHSLRSAFLVGYMQAEFIRVLVNQNKTVLS